ncbi:MAG: Uma2 family endonuclease [Planctomycetota bacterium]|nr:MAG: Uma2 family endonuclease [Planctomycetota bacterium]
MSTAFSTYVGPPGVGTITLPVSPLTTEQYLRMIDAGILGPSDKVELIGGLITPMAPAGPEHNGSLLQLTEIFARVADRFGLLIQGTVRIAEGQVFDPDLALLRRKPGAYRKALPQPDDILLIVESASTSLVKDRHVKLPIYAAAGIQEYWIADLERQVLHVFRDPQGDGYNSERALKGDQTVTPLACPDLAVRAADIFQ